MNMKSLDMPARFKLSTRTDWFYKKRKRTLERTVSIILDTWQMSALRLEAILIGYIVNSVGLTIIADIRERTTYNDRLMIGSDVLQFAFLFVQFTIASLNTGTGAGIVEGTGTDMWVSGTSSRKCCEGENEKEQKQYQVSN